jgi:phosphotransferase system enzyme I (PtsI)
MASQPLMAFALIGLGVRQLSVSPRSVSVVKRIVRGISAATAEEAANAALGARTAETARHELHRRLSAAMPELGLLEEGLTV